MSKITEEKTLEGLNPFTRERHEKHTDPTQRIKIRILIEIFLDQDLRDPIEPVNCCGESWSVVWLYRHPSAFLGFHLTTSSALDATQALNILTVAHKLDSCTRPITFNTATIASRLKILTVGGRANWVNCSPYTRFCTRSMAPNTETTNLESSFILDFGDPGLTLHNALTYATAVSTSRFRSYPCPPMPDGAKYRKYCRMNEVNLWRYARRPSYSLESSKSCFVIPSNPLHSPSDVSCIHASSFINSARDDFGWGGSRIRFNIDLMPHSAPHGISGRFRRKVYPSSNSRDEIKLDLGHLGDVLKAPPVHQLPNMRRNYVESLFIFVTIRGLTLISASSFINPARDDSGLGGSRT
ncbi:hypothetical protein DFH09DRAFT_1102790 [Mycena vulgaris]|nr:hypothetical protein DFH09DRAFT_1102790 [Mycena vulgaris]